MTAKKRKRLVERLWAVWYDSEHGPFFGHGSNGGRATFFARGKAKEYELECRRSGGPNGKVVRVEMRVVAPVRKPRNAVRR